MAMKKILYFAAALFCAGSSVFAQNPRRVPPRQAPVTTTTVAVPLQQTVSPNAAIYTCYNINSPVGGGVATDESWNRPSSESLVDSYYMPALPRIPEEMAPVKKKKGETDPFRDNTRRIFESNSLTTGLAGGYDNASVDKELLAIELFGYGRRVPADLAEAVRARVAAGAAKRSRHYVLDAQTQLGGAYDGSPVYYGGAAGSFHFSPRMEALYCRGVRYVISGVVAEYFTHQYYTSEKAKKPTFETLMTVYLTAYDLDKHMILQTYWINATGTGNRQELADNEALACFESKAFNMVMDNFPIITTFTSYGETDRKGEIKNATIAAGVDMGVVKTDIFHVFYSADPYGKKIGKVKATHPAINGSECNITGGQKDITEAVNSGANLFLLSKGQALF